jgi:hypothetical protein
MWFGVRLSEVTTYASGALAGALLPEVAGSRGGGEQAEFPPQSDIAVDGLYKRACPYTPLVSCALIHESSFWRELCAPPPGPFVGSWLPRLSEASTIVISGLQGFGYPGLSTIARFLSAAVTVPAILILILADWE